MTEPKAKWPFPDFNKPAPIDLNDIGPENKTQILVVAERHLQKKKYSAEHDMSHTLQDWQLILVELITDVKGGHTPAEIYRRVAATAEAALEAHFRKETT